MQDADVIRRRIGAALIDIGLVLVLLVLVARLFGNDEASNSSARAEIQGRPQALFLLLTLAYFFGTEARWAQTLGKRLRVVRVDGSTAKAADLRYAFRSPVCLQGFSGSGRSYGACNCGARTRSGSRARAVSRRASWSCRC